MVTFFLLGFDCVASIEQRTMEFVELDSNLENVSGNHGRRRENTRGILLGGKASFNT